jgi:hypothetical protein
MRRTAAALQRYAPDVFTAIGDPAWAGTILCPQSLALSRRPLPADDPAAAQAIVRYHVLARPLSSTTALQEGEDFVSFLPNARVYASRRGGGPLVHLYGGDEVTAMAPLPVDNTASVLGVEAARGSGKGTVALIDVVLQPPASAMPPPSSSGVSSPALDQARILTTTPAMATMATMPTTMPRAVAENGTEASGNSTAVVTAASKKSPVVKVIKKVEKKVDNVGNKGEKTNVNLIKSLLPGRDERASERGGGQALPAVVVVLHLALRISRARPLPRLRHTSHLYKRTLTSPTTSCSSPSLSPRGRKQSQPSRHSSVLLSPSKTRPCWPRGPTRVLVVVARR